MQYYNTTMSDGTVSSSVDGKLANCYSSEFHRSVSAVYPWLDSVMCNVVPPTAKARSELW